MEIEKRKEKMINHQNHNLYWNREILPGVQIMQLRRLGKPISGLQILDTRVNFPVPVQSDGRLF